MGIKPATLSCQRGGWRNIMGIKPATLSCQRGSKKYNDGPIITEPLLLTEKGCGDEVTGIQQ